MEDYFKDIKKRLEKKINFEKLEIINNSHKHKGHKFFSEERYHLHLKIRMNNYLLLNLYYQTHPKISDSEKLLLPNQINIHGRILNL